MMVLMTSQPKKSAKTATVTFVDFNGYENIELDSLESYAADAEVNMKIINTRNILNNTTLYLYVKLNSKITDI